MAGNMLRENTREDIEEGCKFVAESRHELVIKLALVCSSGFDGKSKIAAKWAPSMFEVLKKFEE